MSTRKKPRNFVQRLLRRVWRSFNFVTKALLNWVLRGFMVHKRPRLRQSQSGFVLPTVVMVLLVVALLTTAIVIRSFDRSKNASNYRVDQAVLNAATPALDRARAKIERLFSPEENRLTSNPPAEGLDYDEEGTISQVLSTNTYTFGDETPLKVVFDVGKDGAYQKSDQIKTAWKFPVDTDNDGKFDTYTLYGIYFRNPESKSDSNQERARTPLDARARPQVTGQSDACTASDGGSSQDLQGWYETDGQLKKAFFTYVANVPISQADITKLPATEQAKYEPYTGNKSFSALEMQQDQGQIALDNNAVWYNDDLVISNVPPFRLNGRIHTNSNLMVAGSGTDPIIFYQVSSINSCYYTAENAKIIVGGHVSAGDITNPSNTANNDQLVQIHLYKPKSDLPQTPPITLPSENINGNNVTTTFNPNEIATNSNAYETRLNFLVNAGLNRYDAAYPDTKDLNALVVDVATVKAKFPEEIGTKFESKYDADNPSSGPSILKQVLTTYFAERIRRPSVQEVPMSADPNTYLRRTPNGGTALTFANVFTGDMMPPIEWMRYNTADLKDLPVKDSGAGYELETSNPSTVGTGRKEVENLIGDRIKVGNSLPSRWLKDDNTTYADAQAKQDLTKDWSAGGGKRTRESLVEQLDDLGDTSRGGYWERAAALSGQEFESPSAQELAGGLRVITGAGIYIDGKDRAAGGTGIRGTHSFLPEPPAKNGLELKQMAEKEKNANDRYGILLPPEVQNQTDPNVLKGYTVVWPDTMPMYENINGNIRRGDLQMRATVVYHYAEDPGTDQEPIACIATFYDPTNSKTAQNFNGLPKNPDPAIDQSTTEGASINGINYPVTYATANRSTVLSNLKLQRQANMLFPNGRWVNQPLHDAVVKLSRGLELNLADIAAIDAANCALGILDNPTATSSSVVPDFAIEERAFLDARQIKALHKRIVKVDQNGIQPLTNIGADPNDVNQMPSRITRREDIGNPDKLKIAQLGELNLPITTVPNYPFYSLPIEQRQPLEIRVTQIDLDRLRKKATKTPPSGNNEYLLPNSGIIYASRDDALRDISNFDAKTGGDKGSSATDFLLDPTRRPNGILLVNGANLLREKTYRTAEKGLILATDLPVYIKSQKLTPDAEQGGFNLHLQPDATTISNTTTREEFTALLLDDYTNFYDRDNLDPNFACRQGQTNKCTEGDQWRAARILSDAVTLLSSNFRFGYRNEGDFDLNNNAGNEAVESRLKNGFWWNGFATNGEWLNTGTGFPKDFDTIKTGTQGSTYVSNGVTPIQRRVSFTEYQMEICRKLPVSACGPGDWTLAGAGTTASTAATPPGEPLRYVKPEDRRYPRRVAFKRNSFGEIDMPNCSISSLKDCKPIPIAVNGNTLVEVVYGDGAGTDDMGTYGGISTLSLPDPVPNALWFWTTGDDNNPSPVTGTIATPTDILTLPPNVSYNNTNKLYYAPYDPEEVSERQILLPGLPDFPPEMRATLGIPQFGLNLNSIPGLTSTNLNSAPSDYAVFSFEKPDLSAPPTNCQFSKDHNPATAALAQCSTVPEDNTNQKSTAEAIQYLWTGFQLIKSKQTVNDGVVYIDTNDNVNPKPLLNLSSNGKDSTNFDRVTLKAYAKVNVYTLPKAFNNKIVLSGVEITFDRNNRIDDPIFVLVPEDYTQDVPLIFQNYVKVMTKGVDPNNIFWVPGKYLNIRVHNDTNDHELAGNFIGSGIPGQAVLAFTDNEGNLPAPPLGAKKIVKGGRFLGFTINSIIPNDVMTAMTTASQPLLIPVLNLHSPGGDLASPFAAGNNKIEEYWVQRVPGNLTENYNAVFIMGDSPARPFTPTLIPMNNQDRGESGGGLANFPRFLETWKDGQGQAKTKIRGSFIQFKRSIFATAPFEAIDNPQADNSLFFDNPPGGKPDYMANYSTAAGQGPERPYTYKGGGQLQKAPYYTPPRRLWGYDVGLLKQTPDLFSRRFSTPSAGVPNEYFREVSRDDLWVQTLLCAAEETPPVTPGAPSTYTTWAISDPKQRPNTCQEPTPPPNKYDDPST